MNDTSGFKDGTQEGSRRAAIRAPWTVMAWTLALSPALVVVVSRLSVDTSGLGPSVAQGATDTTALPDLPAMPLGDRDRLRSAGGVQASAHGLNWVRAGADAATQAPVAATEPALVVPDFALTSIMVARGEAIAVVKGKMRRQGESPASGWTISRIEPDAGTVTFTHESGREEVVALRGREPR